MQAPLDLLIVSSSPLVAGAVDSALTDSRSSHRPERWVDLDSLRHLESPHPEVLLLAPRTWREFDRILTELPPSLSACPWLVMADLRLAGLFLCRLKHQPCAIVALYSPPEQLASALAAVADGEFTCPEAQMVRRFVHGLPVPRVSALRQFPSPVEMQCGCGVSLGLCNSEIAQLLHVSEGTIKSHLHRVLRKLGQADRRQLGILVRQALTVESATSGGR